MTKEDKRIELEKLYAAGVLTKQQFKTAIERLEQTYNGMNSEPSDDSPTGGNFLSKWKSKKGLIVISAIILLMVLVGAILLLNLRSGGGDDTIVSETEAQDTMQVDDDPYDDTRQQLIDYMRRNFEQIFTLDERCTIDQYTYGFRDIDHDGVVELLVSYNGEPQFSAQTLSCIFKLFAGVVKTMEGGRFPSTSLSREGLVAHRGYNMGGGIIQVYSPRSNDYELVERYEITDYGTFKINNPECRCFQCPDGGYCFLSIEEYSAEMYPGWKEISEEDYARANSESRDLDFNIAHAVDCIHDKYLSSVQYSKIENRIDSHFSLKIEDFCTRPVAEIM